MATLFFICKRRPQGRDLLTRPYGRFNHLPILLARMGHQVHVAVIGQPAPDSVRDGVVWHAPGGLAAGSPRRLSELVRATRPDWLLAGSDAWVGCIAHALARRCDARLAIDAYDNFESYMPWNWPLHWLWRRAVCAADLVTAAGPQLAALLDLHRPLGAPTEILPMAADPGFVPLDRARCRAELCVPPAEPLLGYGGSWTGRGVAEILPLAFARVRAHMPDAQLALTGRPPAAVLRQPGVIALGYLADEQMPIFLNAIDLATVIARDDRFGRYSYPAKLCEAIACGTRVVATATAPIASMLQDQPEMLVPVAAVPAFADAVLAGLQAAAPRYAPRPDWQVVATAFNRLLLR